MPCSNAWVCRLKGVNCWALGSLNAVTAAMMGTKRGKVGTEGTTAPAVPVRDPWPCWPLPSQDWCLVARVPDNFCFLYADIYSLSGEVRLTLLRLHLTPAVVVLLLSRIASQVLSSLAPIACEGILPWLLDGERTATYCYILFLQNHSRDHLHSLPHHHSQWEESN